MRFGQTAGGRAPHTPSAGREKRKLFLLTVALLFVGVAYVASVIQSERREADQYADLPLPEEEIPEATLVLPDIDVPRLESLVSDAVPEDRVILERDALDYGLELTRRIVERQYEALGIEELDAERIAAVLADPASARGRAFRARGWIERLRKREAGPGRPEEYTGALLLEDGGAVWFVTSRLKQRGGTEMGDFVRLDGLFLKAYTDELGEDGWVEGPLLVASGMRRSYPEQEPVTAEELERELAGVQDDGLENGISGLPERPLWALMGYAHQLAEEEEAARERAPDGAAPEPVFDWESAPELNKLALKQILDDGPAFRGQAFRIPVSSLQAIAVARAEENPLRLDRFTRGWFGNTTWSDVIQFELPGDAPGLERKELASARGFFLKNLSYEAEGAGLRQAPFFVLESIREHVPPEDHSLEVLLGIVGLIVIGGIAGLTWLVSRDRKKTAQLHEDLVRRRRARRAREAEKSGAVQPGGSSA